MYQQTHPVLFSDRAIYVIVFSLRAQSLSTAELTRHVMNVSVRCKDAPILIVGTHADVVGGGGASVSLATLKQRFPQVRVRVAARYPPPPPTTPLATVHLHPAPPPHTWSFHQWPLPLEHLRTPIAARTSTPVVMSCTCTPPHFADPRP